METILGNFHLRKFTSCDIFTFSSNLIERSFKKSWNVMNHRCLLVFSRKHNSTGNHLFFWLFFYPITWFLIISLFMGIFLNDSLIRNVDKFQIIIVFLFVSLRNLIVSVKYGYYRGEDYEQLSKDLHIGMNLKQIDD